MNGTQVIKPIKSVTLEFDDGSIETFYLENEAGFYRESYTYKPKEGVEATGIRKWGARIDTFEIYWAIEVAPQKTT